LRADAVTDCDVSEGERGGGGGLIEERVEETERVTSTGERDGVETTHHTGN
jgi:hypothetical protein